MRCDEITSRLEAYMDGELEADETRAFDGHCAGCSACAAHLAGRRDLRRLARTGLEVEVPAGLRRQILSAAHGRERRAVRASDGRPRCSRRLRPQTWVPALALVAALAIVLLAPRDEPRVDAPVPFSQPAVVTPWSSGTALDAAQPLEQGTLELSGRFI